MVLTFDSWFPDAIWQIYLDGINNQYGTNYTPSSLQKINININKGGNMSTIVGSWEIIEVDE